MGVGVGGGGCMWGACTFWRVVHPQFIESGDFFLSSFYMYRIVSL